MARIQVSPTVETVLAFWRCRHVRVVFVVGTIRVNNTTNTDTCVERCTEILFGIAVSCSDNENHGEESYGRYVLTFFVASRHRPSLNGDAGSACILGWVPVNTACESRSRIQILRLKPSE